MRKPKAFSLGAIETLRHPRKPLRSVHVASAGCGAGALAVLDEGLHNPCAPTSAAGVSFDDYYFGTPRAVSAGSYDLCWAHMPATAADYRVAVGAGFTLAGPVAVRCRRFHPCHDLLSTSVLNQGGELR